VWWELYNNIFIANCPQSVPVKELLKWSIFGEGIDKSTVARKCSAARYMPVCSGGCGAYIQACQPPMCRCAPM